ncbi:Pr6Pr family membrane protein [Terrabacter terrigena]|uniref:Pr6Pr family membrane protein n=1 Tax=Terrabacter terrigena TaxID=574718 RepID=A0ABW3MUZ6_9MICO
MTGPSTRQTIGRYWHLATFAVTVFALVFQLYLVASGDSILDSSAVTTARPEQIRRYFSYFTIQANLLVAVSTYLLVRVRRDSQVLRVLRLASLIGITVTGIVAAVALPPSPSYTTGSLVCDRLLHIVVPVLTFVGWVAFGPRGLVARADVLPSLIWPIVWLVATLTLGPVVHWYPYPFINVDRIGYGSALLSCTAIAALFLALATLALWADRRLSRDRATMAG